MRRNHGVANTVRSALRNAAGVQDRGKGDAATETAITAIATTGGRPIGALMPGACVYRLVIGLMVGMGRLCCFVDGIRITGHRHADDTLEKQGERTGT